MSKLQNCVREHSVCVKIGQDMLTLMVPSQGLQDCSPPPSESPQDLGFGSLHLPFGPVRIMVGLVLKSVRLNGARNRYFTCVASPFLNCFLTLAGRYLSSCDKLWARMTADKCLVIIILC